MRQPAPAFALATLVLAAALAGCITSSQPLGSTSLTQKVFDTSRAWSMPTTPALYEMLEPVNEFVDSFDGTSISLGLIMPDMPGCDWTAESLPAECRIPAVMDAGPYYGGAIDTVKFRPPLAEWLVPRGYAMVYMSIRGTGESGGCMELFSLNEQKDVDHIVTWLAERPWSNGNIGMMGRSYDGTTPLYPAALGNPHLKTIVPISSVPDLRDLMFKNGTSEFRGPIFHNVVYWEAYGVAPGADYRAPHLAEQACQAVVDGTIDPTRAALTGDTSGAYFEERVFRERILENYKGSIWIVHGLEDWNVNPSQVVPWVQQLQDAGIPTKAWLGVWGHAYPDRSDEHRNVRWDWADQTVAWMDYWLKGQGAQPRLDMEVEDSLFVWRAEATYPPRDSVPFELELAADRALAPMGEGAAGEFVLGGSGLTTFAGVGSVGDLGPGGDMVTFQSAPLEQDVRIAGLPQVHVTATPTTPVGGHLFAEVYDVFPDGRAVRISWGGINLRFHAGGNQGGEDLVPGQPVRAMMELEPTDAHVGRGHTLRLVLHRNGVEDVLPSPGSEPVVLGLGGGASVLRLPEVQREDVLPTYVPPGLGQR